jgi:hypothetical protein
MLGIALLAIAGTYYLLGAAIPESALDDAVGPRGLPRIYAIVLAALAIVPIVRGVLVKVLKPDTTNERRLTPLSSRFVGLTLIGVAYLAVVPWLGYLVSIALLIAATARYQGGSITGRVLLVASSGALFLWLLFVVLLGIPQPSGAWSAIF